jgi:hypothetical protein
MVEYKVVDYGSLKKKLRLQLQGENFIIAVPAAVTSIPRRREEITRKK